METLWLLVFLAGIVVFHYITFLMITICGWIIFEERSLFDLMTFRLFVRK